MKIEEINLKTKEGNLLLAAIGLIGSEYEKELTPDEILGKIVLTNKILDKIQLEYFDSKPYEGNMKLKSNANKSLRPYLKGSVHYVRDSRSLCGLTFEDLKDWNAAPSRSRLTCDKCISIYNRL